MGLSANRSPDTDFQMSAEYTLSRTFTFEAAHSLSLKGTPDAGSGYKRLHGHSFTCILSVKGKKSETKDWLMDFDHFGPVIEKLKVKLDHAYLNNLEDLPSATLENLCAYILDLAKQDLSGLAAIELQRKTCGQSCKLEITD